MMTVRAVEKGTGRVRTGRIGGGSGSGGVAPAFQADFKALSALPAGVSFSRATGGTYFDASGVLQTAAIDAPRSDFAWNGSAWIAVGLLIEEQRTNSLLSSNNFADGSHWALGNATITSGVADPDGGTSAFTLTATANGGQIYQNIATTNGGCASLWIKRRTGTGSVSLRLNGSTDQVIAVSSSWQRLFASGVAGGGNLYLDLVLATGGDAVDICRGQLEEAGAAFPTSYIPTTTAAVTRSADIVQLTGAALAALQASAGSLFAELQTTTSGNNLSVSRIVGYQNPNTPLYIGSETTVRSYDGTANPTASLGSGGFSSIARVGFAWDAGGFSIAGNGSTATASTPAFAVSPTRADLGSNEGSSNFADAWYRSLAIYSSRLSDADLQAKSVVGAAF